jgi:DNA replication protein DnaC
VQLDSAPRTESEAVHGGTAAAGALLDRFLHHAENIKIQGKSYRMHDRQRNRSATISAARTD